MLVKGANGVFTGGTGFIITSNYNTANSNKVGITTTFDFQWKTNLFKTLGPWQNGRHFPDDIFKCICLNENVWISLKISAKLVVKVPIDIKPALVEKMAWHRPGESEPMMVNLLTHICVTWLPWVKGYILLSLSVALFPLWSPGFSYDDRKLTRRPEVPVALLRFTTHAAVFLCQNFRNFVFLDNGKQRCARTTLPAVEATCKSLQWRHVSITVMTSWRGNAFHITLMRTFRFLRC